jgi:adenylate cyclase
VRFRPTLSQAFVAVLGAIALALTATFVLVVRQLERSIAHSAETLQRSAGQRASAAVEGWLKQAERAVDDIERLVRSGACASPAACLGAELEGSDQLAEVTITRRDGTRVSAVRDHGRVSIARATIPDPTRDASFATPAEQPGRTLWSDLAYSGLDEALPEQQRRVVVDVLRAIDRDRVIRVALLADQLGDTLGRIRVHENDPRDPFRMALVDEQGRFLSKLSPDDPLRERGDDLRVEPRSVPPAFAAAVQRPELVSVDATHPFALTRIQSGGHRFVAAARALESTQDWRLLIVGPEDYYLNELRATQRKLAAGGALLLLLAIASGAGLLRSLRRAFARIGAETERMGRFRFEAAAESTRFRDVGAVLDGLEHAKAALRALGRFVPVELVRQLYAAGRDPSLGGESRELTLMFTDLAGFTSVAERLPPDRLARALGLYFAAMTEAIEASGGTVDKYIGDAVMAMWNAPAPLADHAVRACSAALACLEATRKLFASPAWAGLPPLVTRFGVHTAEVLVGNFGAPSRMSYTAMGDGVNLASRLEGLNKQYGSTILVSADVARAVREHFELRRLDRVAVKGRAQPVEVYELLGPAGGVHPAAQPYEIALEAYFTGRFDLACAILERQSEDPPSAVLLARCRQLMARPPHQPWNGVFVATSK